MHLVVFGCVMLCAYLDGLKYFRELSDSGGQGLMLVGTQQTGKAPVLRPHQKKTLRQMDVYTCRERERERENSDLEF